MFHPDVLRNPKKDATLKKWQKKEENKRNPKKDAAWLGEGTCGISESKLLYISISDYAQGANINT